MRILCIPEKMEAIRQELITRPPLTCPYLNCSSLEWDKYFCSNPEILHWILLSLSCSATLLLQWFSLMHPHFPHLLWIALAGVQAHLNITSLDNNKALPWFSAFLHRKTGLSQSLPSPAPLLCSDCPTHAGFSLSPLRWLLTKQK